MKLKFFFLILLSLIVNISFSQEYLINNLFNAKLNKYSKNIDLQNNPKIGIDTVKLPFFEDFSHSDIYPDTSKFIDKYVFINNEYDINNISYNVATFDVLDSDGSIYTHLVSSGSRIADYLSSVPINLNYLPGDSLYFSFFYQSAGNGNMPEFNDSLVLQFKTSYDEWVSVWYKEGGVVMDSFNLVQIPIISPDFLYSGFQFRFYNYASIGSNYEPSWRSNCDVWNIDYIQIDTNRSIYDTIINDISFIKNFNSLLKDFESVPCKHYTSFQAQSELIKDSIMYNIRNNCNETYGISRDFYLYNTYSNSLISDEYVGDEENIYPLSTLNYNKNIEDIEFVISPDADSAKFTLLGCISARDTTESIDKRWNDTIRYYQYFDNYYAYDDGSAELGYDVSGTNSKLAYKFTPLVSDTLKGVYMYFNQVIDEANRIYFYLSIWDDDNGVPGNLIHEIEGVKPEYSLLNNFVYYPLDSFLLMDTTFYIGWRKTTNDVLNVGFDINKDCNGKIFFNTSGNWEQSQFSGSLLIRPVFGRIPENLSADSYQTDNYNISVFPNPANGILNISGIETANIEIYNISGQLVFSQQNINNNSSINIENLQTGIYILRVKEKNNIYTQKIVVEK